MKIEQGTPRYLFHKGWVHTVTHTGMSRETKPPALHLHLQVFTPDDI